MKEKVFNAIYAPLLLMVLLAPVLSGCNNNGGGKEILALVNERDSLRRTLEQENQRFEVYNSVVEIINSTLDSIEYHENMIYVNSFEENTSQDKILKSIKRYDNLIKRQEERIKELEAQLNTSDNANAESKRLISFLKREIERKDEEIKSLKAEIESKDFDISNLRATVNSKNSTISELNRRNSEQQAMIENQNKALATQDEMLNNGYVIIATKSELNGKGITKKGKIQPTAALNRGNFNKVDIRKFTEVRFNAKKPMILTSMPQSSYRLINNGKNSFTLYITNPSDFWRMSSYLVISID